MIRVTWTRLDKTVVSFDTYNGIWIFQAVRFWEKTLIIYDWFLLTKWDINRLSFIVCQVFCGTCIRRSFGQFQKVAASHWLGCIYISKINLGPFELRLERNKDVWLIVVLAHFSFFLLCPQAVVPGVSLSSFPTHHKWHWMKWWRKTWISFSLPGNRRGFFFQ